MLLHHACGLCARWRVEAEVKMELERLRANGGAEGAAAGGGAAGARMAEELIAARGRCETLEADVGKWEAALAARDVELQNLQRALGEPSQAARAGRLPEGCLLLPATAPAGCAAMLSRLAAPHTCQASGSYRPSGVSLLYELQAS